VGSAPLLASVPQVVPRLSPPAVRKWAADPPERGVRDAAGGTGL